MKMPCDFSGNKENPIKLITAETNKKSEIIFG